MSSRIGAEYGERSPERVTQRTRVSVPGVGYPGGDYGAAHLLKLREGSYFTDALLV